MANIDNEISRIRTAIYGTDMRKAIGDLALKINAESEEAYTKTASYRGKLETLGYSTLLDAATKPDSKVGYIYFSRDEAIARDENGNSVIGAPNNINVGGICITYKITGGGSFQIIISTENIWFRYINSNNVPTTWTHLTHTDDSLSIVDAPADAATVGNMFNKSMVYRGTMTSLGYTTLLDVLNDVNTRIGYVYFSSDQASARDENGNSVIGGPKALTAGGISITYNIPGSVTFQILISIGKIWFRHANAGNKPSSWVYLTGTDSTLTLANTPADAATVGDMFNKSMVYRGTMTSLGYTTFLDVTNDVSTRIGYVYFTSAQGTAKDENGNSIIGGPSNLTAGGICVTYKIPGSVTFQVIISIGKMWFRSVNTSGVAREWTDLTSTDKTLSVSGSPADAAAVGNKLQLPMREAFNIDLRDSSNYTYLIGADQSLITSDGYYCPTDYNTNKVIIDKYCVCDTISYRANIKLDNESTGSCVLGTINGRSLNSALYTSSMHATVVKFDFTNGRVAFMTSSSSSGGGNVDGASLPQYEYSTISLENLSGTEYRIEIGREKRAVYARVYNLTTGKLCGYKRLSAYDDTTSYAGKAGALYDFPTFGVIDGGITFKRVSVAVPTNVYAAFLGDSITEGSQLAYNDVWVNKVIDWLGRGVNCGRGGGNIDHMIRCAQDLLPAMKPEYVFVGIGTNGGNTLTKLNTLINAIRSIGAIPVINCIPRRTADKNATVEAINNDILSLGTDHIRFDIATSINNDLSLNQNESLFASDNTHPNIKGGKVMYERFVADMGWIKS